jgi:hypothetical protein
VNLLIGLRSSVSSDIETAEGESVFISGESDDCVLPDPVGC